MSSSSARPIRAARNIRLRGREAVDALASAGWVVSHGAEKLVYAGDYVKRHAFVVSRCWHTAGTFEFTGRRHLPVNGALMLIAVTEGELTVNAGGFTRTVRPGCILLVSADTLDRVQCDRPVALAMVVLQGQNLQKDACLAVGAAAADYLPLLLGLTNSLLAYPISPDDPTFARVERAVTELVVAVTASSDLEFDVRQSHTTDHLFLKALALISAHAPDPSTTVESIARTLGVSRSHLFRIFQASDETPSNCLRRTRASLAADKMREGIPAELAAMTSGFGSVRRMRRALEAEGFAGAREQPPPSSLQRLAGTSR